LDRRIKFLTPFIKLCAFFCGFAYVHNASAWDGAVSGVITGIDTVTAEPGNFEFRVFLGTATICNGPIGSMNGWGYLNSSDSNYKVTVANLMLAFAAGKNVMIFSMVEGGACHIRYVAIRN